MYRNDFRMLTTWDIACTPAEFDAVLRDVLGDPRAFARICPAVFRDVTVVEAGRADGTGTELRLRTSGRLPYTLDWSVLMTEAVPGVRYVQRAEGDFEGRAVWTIEATADPGRMRVHLDWRLRVHKPLLRALMFACKPLFEANHRWAMRRGYRDLCAELAHRRRVAA